VPVARGVINLAECLHPEKRKMLAVDMDIVGEEGGSSKFSILLKYN